MNFKNLVWKNRHARIWLIVSVSVLVFIFVVTMVATQVSLFRGSINLFLGGYRARLGDARYLFDPDFDSKDEVFAAANKLNIEIAEEGFTLLRNEPLGTGGLSSLPLRGAAPRVSVFGNNSIDLLYGGSGSGDGYVDRENRTIFESLTAAGIVYNPALPAFYNSAASGPGRPESPGFVAMLAGFRTGQTPWVNYNAQLRSTFTDYNDAAIVVITRIGGEGYDLPRTVKGDGYVTGTGAIIGDPIPGFDNRHRIPAPQNNIVPTTYDTISGHRDEAGDRVGGHYLQLCNNEIDLLLNVSYYFDNVIIIINSNNILELGFLDDLDYWLCSRYGFNRPSTDIPAIQRAMQHMRGVLWIGSPGSYGIMALGRILTGAVNPSGRTVNVHARNFRHNPTYLNFGNNQANMGNAYIDASTGVMRDLALRNYFVEYEEGIYVGYRYYETRAFTELQSNPNSTWWDDNVIFPFGFGLSYSTFNWELGDVNLARRELVELENGTEEYQLVPFAPLAGTTIANVHRDAFITIDVTVSHYSGPSGRDVVQLYVRTPFYSQGITAGIEKAHVVLMDFGKTGVLTAGESETLTLSFSFYDIASYDYSDANGNGFIGWETEAGDYTIYVSRHANSWMREGRDDAALSVDFTVPEFNDNAPNAATVGLGSTGFTFRRSPHVAGTSDVVNRFNNVSQGSPNSNKTVLSRADWTGTWPSTPTVSERTVTAEFLDSLVWNMAVADNPASNNPWIRTQEQMPIQAADLLTGDDIEIMFDQLIGVAHNDPKWQTFLNQLTVTQMVHLTGVGAFGTIALENLGIPLVTHTDGPSGFVNFVQAGLPTDAIYGTAFYVSQCILGATFNKNLAREFGLMIGNESLIGNERGDGMPYTGWYAPGANIHRSPFSGRNWEYFSEDPMHTGIMAAEVILGAQEKGVIAFPKHFALNDQESNRSTGGLLVWANEQTMREIYLRAFEILVKQGRPLGMMSTYTRIGCTWGGGDHRLLNEVLRGEWGFVGTVVTDFADFAYMNPNQMIRAGGDLQLFQTLGFGTVMQNLPDNPTHVYALRAASHNILYSTVNSNAMNYEFLGTRLPLWIVALIWVNIGLLIAFLGWGAAALWLSYKKLKPSLAGITISDAQPDDTPSSNTLANSDAVMADNEATSQNEPQD